jgi:hypothetical protein
MNYFSRATHFVHFVQDSNEDCCILAAGILFIAIKINNFALEILATINLCWLNTWMI